MRSRKLLLMLLAGALIALTIDSSAQHAPWNPYDLKPCVWRWTGQQFFVGWEWKWKKVGDALVKVAVPIYETRLVRVCIPSH